MTTVKVENIDLDSWDTTAWATEIPNDAVRQIFEHTQAYATKTVEWYEARKKWKAAGSQWFRGLAIVAGIVGGLAPLAAGFFAGDGVEAAKGAQFQLLITQAGFLLIAIGGGLILADRLFGVSSGWIRYVAAMTEVQSLRARFNLDWANLMLQISGTYIDPNTSKPSKEKLAPLVQRASEFAAAVRAVVVKETESWQTEFQTSLGELQKVLAESSSRAEITVKDARKALDVAAAAGEFGRLNVTIDAATKPTAGSVTLDDSPKVPLTGNTCAIANVPPGDRRALVVVEIAGEMFEKVRYVNVKPGGISAETFKFP